MVYGTLCIKPILSVLMYLKYICIYGEEQVVRLNVQVGVSI